MKFWQKDLRHVVMTVIKGYPAFWCIPVIAVVIKMPIKKFLLVGGAKK